MSTKQNRPALILNGDLLRLEQAAPCHRAAAEEMKREFFSRGETVINGSALFDQLDFDSWLDHVRRSYSPETVSGDWAVSTAFFAVRQADGGMIGMIDVRHALTTPYLRDFAGNIGYAVRPTEHRKTYATEMLRLALVYSKILGMSTPRANCYADNTASVGVIRACGGTMAEEKLWHHRTIRASGSGGVSRQNFP